MSDPMPNEEFRAKNVSSADAARARGIFAPLTGALVVSDTVLLAIMAACSPAGTQQPEIPKTPIAIGPTPTVDFGPTDFGKSLEKPTPQMQKDYAKFYEYIDRIKAVSFIQFGADAVNLNTNVLVPDKATFEANLAQGGMPYISMGDKSDSIKYSPAFWGVDVRLIKMPKGAKTVVPPGSSSTSPSAIAEPIDNKGNLAYFSPGLGVFTDGRFLSGSDTNTAITLISTLQPKIVNFAKSQFDKYDGKGGNPQTVIMLTPEVINSTPVLVLETQNGTKSIFAVMDQSGKITNAPAVDGKILVKENDGTLRYYDAATNMPTGQTLDLLTGALTGPATATPKSTEVLKPTATATAVATATAPATPTEAATVTSTATPDAKAQLQEYLQGADAMRAIQQYATAEGMNMNDVLARLQDPKSLVTLKDGQGNPFEVLVDTKTADPKNGIPGTPLFIEVNGAWKEIGLDDLSSRIHGIDFGTDLYYKTKDGSIINDSRYNSVVNKNFDMATISAGIYWKWLEREPGQMDSWSLGDMNGQLQEAKSFANIKNIRLHALFFPESYPDWLNKMSPDEVKNAMFKHIEFLADKYKGIVQEVVVVNEPYYSGPLFTGGGSFIRHDTLYEKLGPDYIKEVFAKARELFGPDVKLIYNDTANQSLNYGPNGGYTKLTQTNIAALKGLVDYAGLEMHVDAAYPPTEKEIIDAIQSYGIPAVITEADVRLDHLPTSMSEAQKQKIQADIYKTIINAAIKSAKVKSISFWDTGDKYSTFEHWDNIPNAEATAFDDNFNPKPAYYSMLQALISTNQ